MITEPLNYSFSDPAALDFVAGLAESCEDAGQGLLLVAVGPNRTVSDGSAAVLSAGVDGFVVYSASDDDPYLQVGAAAPPAGGRRRPAQGRPRHVEGLHR